MNEPAPRGESSKNTAMGLPDEAMVDDTEADCNPAVSNSAVQQRTSVSQLRRVHAEKLLTSAIPAELHHLLAMESVGDDVLRIHYLNPDGTPTPKHDGKPFIRERLSEAERDARWLKKRKDNPDAKRPGKYSGPAKEGCRLYHSPLRVSQHDYEERLNDPNQELRITEGEFKTIAANIHDPKTITLGLGGVSSWQDRYDGQSEDEPSAPIIELEELPVQGRRIRLCFDSDHHKPQVRAALRDLANYLDERGAIVLIEVLPSIPEKDVKGEWERLGVDDLVYRFGAKALKAIKAIAQPAFRTKGKEIVYDPEFEPRNTHRRNTYLKVLAGKHWRASTERNGAWVRWTGTHWQPVANSDPILRTIEQVMEANGWEDREQRTVNSLVAAFRRSVDINPPKEVKGLIPCLNGCLRLSDRKLIPHDPEHGNTYCLPFNFNPLADHKPITDVLKEMVTPVELDIFRATAQSIATGYRRKAFVEITGPGNSGKSVFGRLLTALAGTDNTVASDLEKMEDRSGRFETIKLRGKRLALFNECDRYSGPLNTLKAMTGGDRITAELKRGTEPVDFYFTGMTVLVGNSPVRPSDATGAVINRRRSIVVPEVIKTSDERELLEPDGQGWRGEFVDHLPGLLNWALAMTDAQANAALGKDSNDLGRIQRDLDTVFETDNLARWAEEFLVYDPNHPFTQVGNSRDQYLKQGVPRDEWKNLLLPHYEECVPFSVGVVKFKNKLVDLLRDTYGLPLPKGSTRHGEYRNREVGSVIPNVRFRSVTDGSKVGIVTQAALWQVNSSRDGQPITNEDSRDGQNAVGDQCDGCDGLNEIQIEKEEREDASMASLYRSEIQNNPSTRLSSHTKGSARHAPVTPAATHHKPVTAPVTPLLPEPLVNEQIATVHTWVSAAVDAIRDASQTPTPERTYDVLNSWARAPAISRPQVEAAFKRLDDTPQPTFDW